MKCHRWFTFPGFYLFCCRTPWRTPHSTESPCPLRPRLAVTTSQTSCFRWPGPFWGAPIQWLAECASAGVTAVFLTSQLGPWDEGHGAITTHRGLAASDWSLLWFPWSSGWAKHDFLYKSQLNAALPTSQRSVSCLDNFVGMFNFLILWA